jgi:hypothetical protein
MTDRQWVHVNHVQGKDNSFEPAQFSLAARPTTDVYASPLPPTLHVYSAPITHTRLDRSSFRSAQVTFTFVPTLQFDQGGLIVTFPTRANPEPCDENSREASDHPAWVKVGIEVNDGAPWLSVVAKARNGWCDWSLAPCPVRSGLGEGVSAAIELTKFKNALMVYSIHKGARVLIRKVPVFVDDVELSDSLWVGAYAARPDPDSKANGTSLDVHFEHLIIDTGVA